MSSISVIDEMQLALSAASTILYSYNYYNNSTEYLRQLENDGGGYTASNHPVCWKYLIHLNELKLIVKYIEYFPLSSHKDILLSEIEGLLQDDF
jgi:hypothetical protein